MATGERAGATAGAIVAQAHARLLADHTLQFSFIGFPDPQRPPPWLLMLFKVLASIWPVLRFVFLLALAVVLMIALISAIRAGVRWLRRPNPKRQIQLQAEPKAEPLRPAARRAAALLQEADRLAAEQRFDEAAHVLLFRTIDDIEQRRPHAVRPALTSRDIARLEEIPTPARGAFAQLADVVERSFFGSLPLSATDFDACRRAYTTFASPQSWAAGERA